MSNRSLEDLLAEVSPPPTGCAGVSDPAARQFLSLIAVKYQKGEKIVQARAREILSREWGIKLGDDALRNHLTGVCDCET